MEKLDVGKMFEPNPYEEFKKLVPEENISDNQIRTRMDEILEAKYHHEETVFAAERKEGIFSENIKDFNSEKPLSRKEIDEKWNDFNNMVTEKIERLRSDQENHNQTHEIKMDSDMSDSKTENDASQSEKNKEGDIKNDAPQNDVASKDINELPGVVQNKLDGCRRENEVEADLKKKYPESEGYQIIKEAYLRDENGNFVTDPITGEKRRIDFVVIKDGKVVDSIEVTSLTAPKEEQLAKEARIRENGGNYIRDNDGNLVQMSDEIKTRVERRE